VLVGPGLAADPDPKDIADDVAAARKELNAKGSSGGFFNANGKARLEAWKAAAEKGSAAGQWLYGRCFDDGVGVEQNPETAVKWYRQSAEQGFPFGQNSLAWCYRYGEGVEPNAEEALKWLKRAADQKEAVALFNLAQLHELGLGTTADAGEAVRLYALASEAGYVEGTMRLIAANEDGDLVKADRAELAKLNRRAKDQIGDGAEKVVAGYAFRRKPVGRAAPEATGVTGGKEVNLADCRGKVVVVAFTAEWCKPCRDDEPNRKALEKDLKDRPFLLVYVDVDKYPVATEAWGVDTVPRLFVLDPKGVVRESKLKAKDVTKVVEGLVADVKKP
jgi:TPR repeat protein